MDRKVLQLLIYSETVQFFLCTSGFIASQTDLCWPLVTNVIRRQLFKSFRMKFILEMLIIPSNNLFHNSNNCLKICLNLNQSGFFDRKTPSMNRQHFGSSVIFATNKYFPYKLVWVFVDHCRQNSYMLITQADGSCE